MGNSREENFFLQVINCLQKPDGTYEVADQHGRVWGMGDAESACFRAAQQMHAIIEAMEASMLRWTNEPPTVSGNYYIEELGNPGNQITAYVDVEHDEIAYCGCEISETISEQPETVYYYGPLPVPPITDAMKAAAEELANRPETDLEKSQRIARENARANHVAKETVEIDIEEYNRRLEEYHGQYYE